MISQPFITGLPVARSFLILFVILSLSGFVILHFSRAGLVCVSWHEDVIHLSNTKIIRHQTLSRFQLHVKTRDLARGTWGSRRYRHALQAQPLARQKSALGGSRSSNARAMTARERTPSSSHSLTVDSAGRHQYGVVW
jgi:hypothetical protein